MEVLMTWVDKLNNDPFPWLLEDDAPGVKYLVLRDLSDLPEDNPELKQASHAAHKDGPISVYLDQMNTEGYWERPGAGYNPKYRSSVWSIISLAQLGASIEMDERIEKAVNYILDNALTSGGQFGAGGTPSSTADCLQGNLLSALNDLGCEDERLDMAFEWMARTVTGEGLAPNNDRKATRRYYAGKCGPIFECGSNNKLPCAWGAAKVMLAFSKLEPAKITEIIEPAIQQGLDFLFSVDPAEATYPSGWAPKPSGNWWKFGFPVFYVTDILQVVEALIGLGFARDARLENAISIIENKQDEQGCWPMEYSYTGKTWVDFGEKKKPNKWVTIRALRVLKEVYT
jgi:hypothetical protein